MNKKLECIIELHGDLEYEGLGSIYIYPKDATCTHIDVSNKKLVELSKKYNLEIQELPF